MDRFTFDASGLSGLSAIPAAAHRQHLAVEVLRAAWRRRWLVALVATGCLALGMAAATRMVPRYPAEAIIELQLGRDVPAMAGTSTASVVVEAASIVLGEARIVRSRVVLRRVVEQLGLDQHPAFGREGTASRLGAKMRGLLQPAAPPSSASDPKISIAERALLGGLAVETDNRSYLITVTFSSADPELSARVANAVAEAYLAQRLDSNLGAAGRTADWLGSQVEATQAQLRAADAAVAVFRERNRLLELGGQGDTLRQLQLREQGAQLNALVLARGNDEARLARIARLMPDNPAGAVAELSGQAVVQSANQRAQAARSALSEMQSRFGPRHPAVQQAQAALTDADATLSDEITRATEALRASIAAAERTEREMAARIGTTQSALIADAAQEAQLRNLQAAAAALRERLAGLARSHDQAQALRQLRVVPASLIVPAQPVWQPAGVSPVLVAIAALGVGMLLGIVLAVLLDRRDRGFRASGEVVAATDLRCLGLVPELAPPSLHALAANQPSRAQDLLVFEEAVRLVASGIGLFAGGNTERGRIVLVTSSESGEGRSTLCAGLARALSMAGRRVLLIDGPPRRFSPPDEANEQRASTPSPRGEAPGSPLARPRPPGDDGSLVVLHRGSMSGQAMDVFASGRLTSALDQARKHFDVILVEGPPVMLVADALVLGRLADNVIHVAQWAATRRRSVCAALRRMHDHGVAVDGIVLTRVDRRRHAQLGLADPAAFHLHRPARYYSADAAAAAMDAR